MRTFLLVVLTTLSAYLIFVTIRSTKFFSKNASTMAAAATGKLELRPFSKLGSADHGWLDTHHHFSFADYYDPARMHWGALRVWNDDIVKAGTGFGAHPHRDMEIISYVYKGAITHQDHLGNKGRTEAGDVQVMSAGTGVIHSEYNYEDEDDTRFFQIWIMPKERGHKASWGARQFPKHDRAGRFIVLASGFEADQKENDALAIHTDSRVVGASLEKGQTVSYTLDKGRMAYLVPAKGKIEVNGQEVNARDGLAIKDTEVLDFKGVEDSEVVLVDTVPY